MYREQSYFCKKSAEQEMVVRSALWSKSRGLYLEHTSGVTKVRCGKYNGTGINPNWETWNPKKVPGIKLFTPTEEFVANVKKWKFAHSVKNS